MFLKGTSDFLQFLSGGKVIVGSLPLAHSLAAGEVNWVTKSPLDRSIFNLVVSGGDVWRDQFHQGNIKKEFSIGDCRSDCFVDVCGVCTWSSERDNLIFQSLISERCVQYR
ncbi:uncharacterized protein LOC136007994 isoform X3 [Lathamus discolor]|uniref:uncharacterized protein LOC136007994 isoform X3 n=1 Tax=Lathamus discolor TaxID=678569 RepID=UPI0032B75C9D